MMGLIIDPVMRTQMSVKIVGLMLTVGIFLATKGRRSCSRVQSIRMEDKA